MFQCAKSVFNKCSLLIVLFGLAGTGTLLHGAENSVQMGRPLPSSVELYQRYLQNNGGRSNIQALTTIVASGTLTTKEGEVHEFKVYKKRPDKMRLRVNYTDHVTETIYNGARAWVETETNAGTRSVQDLGGEALVSLANESAIEGAFFSLGGHYESIKPVAYEEVRGELAIRIEVDPGLGVGYETIWLSAEHYQEVKMQRTIHRDGSTIPLVEEVFMSDFDKVDGVYFAKSVESRVNGVAQHTVRIEQIRSNVGIFDSYFDKR